MRFKHSDNIRNSRNDTAQSISFAVWLRRSNSTDAPRFTFECHSTMDSNPPTLESNRDFITIPLGNFPYAPCSPASITANSRICLN
jgi:hypothetical protein